MKNDPSPASNKKVLKREIPLSRRRRSRLPRKAREVSWFIDAIDSIEVRLLDFQILQSWFDSHLEDPYPSWHTTVLLFVLIMHLDIFIIIFHCRRRSLWRRQSLPKSRSEPGSRIGANGIRLGRKSTTKNEIFVRRMKYGNTLQH